MCVVTHGKYEAIYDYANHDVTLRSPGNCITLPLEAAMGLFKGMVKANREAKRLGWEATHPSLRVKAQVI